MSRRIYAPLLTTFALLATVPLAFGQHRTRTGSTRTVRAQNGAEYDTLLLAPTSPSRTAGGRTTARRTTMPPAATQASRYAFLREALPSTNPAPKLRVRQASFQQRVDDLPMPETRPGGERIYRGQEPADTRPRLNGVPGEIVREEIVPADTRPRLNSPPDVFRDRPRTVAPSPACQSPPVSTSRVTPMYFGGTPSRGLGRPVNTTFYSTPTNPGAKESRYQVGRGIVGQPTLYVDKQPIRNFIRWLTY